MIERVDDVSAVILAGGQGTRIQAAHPDVPKPLIPINGRPFLYWLTTYLAFFGLRRFVYSTGYRAVQIADWCKDQSMLDVDRICRAEALPLGTGGGLLNCLDLCAKWVLVANGDGLCLGGVDRLLATRAEPSFDGAIVGVPVADTSRYGSLDADSDGLLQRFREKQMGSGLVNGGIYLFRTSLLRALQRPGPLSLERDIIPEILAGGARISVIEAMAAPFLDIGTPESLAIAGQFVTDNIAELTR